jgi:hypothetical protein
VAYGESQSPFLAGTTNLQATGVSKNVGMKVKAIDSKKSIAFINMSSERASEILIH